MLLESAAYTQIPDFIGQSAHIDAGLQAKAGCKLATDKTLTMKNPPHTIFAGAGDEMWFWLNTGGRDACPGLRDYLPAVPDEEIRTLSAQQGDLHHGFTLYTKFRELFLQNGGTFSDSTAVFDFGCGWGRVARFFLRDISGDRIVGVDVNEDAIKACRDTNPWCDFRVNESHPPTDFDDNSFDLIYAFSVFSHLPEELHTLWLKELSRIMRPGGVFVSTTLRRDFITKCAPWHENPDVEDWQRNAGRVFADTDEWLSRYDDGQFCFGQVWENQPFYGHACIPPAYIEKHWAKHFDSVSLLPKTTWTAHQVVVGVHRGES